MHRLRSTIGGEPISSRDWLIGLSASRTLTHSLQLIPGLLSFISDIRPSVQRLEGSVASW